MTLAGRDPESGEAVETPVTNVWAVMAISVWRFTEMLYGPCFAPIRGTSITDCAGLMMSDVETPDPDDPAVAP